MTERNTMQLPSLRKTIQQVNTHFKNDFFTESPEVLQVLYCTITVTSDFYNFI